MSMDNLTYGECYYFETRRDYRFSVLDWLKENGNKPLRRMVAFENDGTPNPITAEMQAKARAKGYVFPVKKKLKRKELAIA